VYQVHSEITLANVNVNHTKLATTVDWLGQRQSIAILDVLVVSVLQIPNALPARAMHLKTYMVHVFVNSIGQVTIVKSA